MAGRFHRMSIFESLHSKSLRFVDGFLSGSRRTLIFDRFQSLAAWHQGRRPRGRIDLGLRVRRRFRGLLEDCAAGYGDGLEVYRAFVPVFIENAIF